MLKARVWSHAVSNGAQELATAVHEYSRSLGNNNLRINSLKLKSAPQASRWTYQPGDYIINYGNSSWEARNFQCTVPVQGEDVINSPRHVARTTDKRVTFDWVRRSWPQEMAIPSTTNHTQARDWLQSGCDIVERHQVKGHSGEGIRIVSGRDNGLPNDLLRAPLYTAYVNKRREFRVHIVRIGDQYQYLIQQKRRRMDHTDPDWRIQNLQNGFIYATEAVDDDVDTTQLQWIARMALRDLDFGAVDILEANNSDYNQQKLHYNGGELLLLEVNSAPGIKADSVKNFYGKAITEVIHVKEAARQ